jgi:hypothetical protein
MPCMLLYGDSGMGKTMLIEKMERQHPNSHHERRGLTLRPVLRGQMPASPDERRFYTRLLEILSVRIGTSAIYSGHFLSRQWTEEGPQVRGSWRACATFAIVETASA